ncbi:MAG: 50S ribosomal protein L17 [Bacteroidetes bacterium]|jgi:large subunit ribosomal protein L17|nr:50S ribosomal protein L17 [Bacteroidota bacterium]
MRHNKKFNHLSRTSSHRKAMLSNMAASLILHKRITTTVAKAKALRVYVEPMITRSKTDSTHSRRMVFRQLQNKFAVNELFRDISVKVADRPGGYTRIIKLGNRLGDNAEMCMIELVDFNEIMLSTKTTKKAKTTRRSRSKKSTSPALEQVEKAVTPEAVTKEEPKAEVVADEAAEQTVESTAEAQNDDEKTKTDDDKAKA